MRVFRLIIAVDVIGQYVQNGRGEEERERGERERESSRTGEQERERVRGQRGGGAE